MRQTNRYRSPRFRPKGNLSRGFPPFANKKHLFGFSLITRPVTPCFQAVSGSVLSVMSRTRKITVTFITEIPYFFRNNPFYIDGRTNPYELF